MPVSVIVTSYNSIHSLELCLDALSRQPEAQEIVVADCSEVNPASFLKPRFPAIEFLYFTGLRSVPELRWAALRATSGNVVAAVEARCVPADDWCAQLDAAHRAHPDAPAIGGPVTPAECSSPRDLGLYFCEYGLYAPPAEQGPSPDLSGANLSYKRNALLESQDLLDAGKWETLLHARWREQGRWPRLCPATVVFYNSMPLATALRQRFWYGWGYAAERVARRSRWIAFSFALAAPLLPFVLTRRLWLSAKKKRSLRAFRRAFGWILLFQFAWAGGEFCGYLFGPPRRSRIY